MQFADTNPYMCFKHLKRFYRTKNKELDLPNVGKVKLTRSLKSLCSEQKEQQKKDCVKKVLWKDPVKVLYNQISCIYALLRIMKSLIRYGDISPSIFDINSCYSCFTRQTLWPSKRPMQSASERTFHQIHCEGQVIFVVDSRILKQYSEIHYSTRPRTAQDSLVACHIVHTVWETVIYMATCLSNEGFIMVDLSQMISTTLYMSENLQTPFWSHPSI